MVQLEKKSLEELRKMASKKKIGGRSKMNKTQLVRALSNKKLMRGGFLDDAQITMLENRDFLNNPIGLVMMDKFGHIIGTSNRIKSFRYYREPPPLTNQATVIQKRSYEIIKKKAGKIEIDSTEERNMELGGRVVSQLSLTTLPGLCTLNVINDREILICQEIPPTASL